MRDDMRGTRALLTIAIVAAVGLLSGCASTGAAVTETTAASARPTAISSPAAVDTGPVGCGALETPDAVAALVGGTGAVQPLEHLQTGTPPSAPPWSVLNANGTVCGWGGLGSLVADQHAPQVFLQSVPGLSAQWSALAAATSPTPGASYDGAASLGGSCQGSVGQGGTGQGYCTTNVLVGDAWMYVTALSDGRSSFTERAFHDFVQGMVTRYSALPAPTPVAPHAVRDCTDKGVLDAVAAGMGATQPGSRGGEDFTLERAQLDAGQATGCPFLSADNPEHGWNGWVSVIDGVDPALFARYRQAQDHPQGRPVDVSGLPGTATGVIEETVDSVRTTVDVLTGTTWVQMYVYGSTDPKAVVTSVSHLLSSGWVG
jgi:hypothetical protein